MKINIKITNLRLRDFYNTNSKVLGYAKKGIHEATETKLNGYLWYHIEDGWVANVDYCIEEIKTPVPTKQDSTKDQLYIPDVLVNIRKESNTSSEKLGTFEKNSYYDVTKVEKKSDFTWYELGGGWCAGIEEVTYLPKGQTNVINKINDLYTSLETAIECIKNGICEDKYNELSDRVIELKQWVDSNFDDIKYDFKTDKEFDEIDILNTTDVHGAWYGYDDGNYNVPVFSYDDIGYYRNKLMNEGIIAFIVDCGDWSRPQRASENEGREAVKQMTDNGFSLSVFGNHEWKWTGSAKCFAIISSLSCICACNLFKDGKQIFAPYKTFKIGSKKLVIIGIGYPSPNGQGEFIDDEWHLDNFTFYDGQKLYKQVQEYIDYFKKRNFDYIFVATHMDKFTEEDYEDDNRYIARSDLLVQNTSGLTAVMQGHYNYQLNPKTLLDKSGNKVLICYNAGANLDCFGRIRIKDNTITSTLITDRSQL